MEHRAILINNADNVVTVVDDVESGATVSYLKNIKISINSLETIPLGHKIAITDIKEGEEVIKYGESIGRATKDIKAGQHVHVHNIESQRGRGDLTN